MGVEVVQPEEEGCGAVEDLEVPQGAITDPLGGAPAVEKALRLPSGDEGRQGRAAEGLSRQALEVAGIDRFESLNEYWLGTEARIRGDFNITGVRGKDIDEYRTMSLTTASATTESGEEPKP